jgi:hypothetical protein
MLATKTNVITNGQLGSHNSLDDVPRWYHGPTSDARFNADGWNLSLPASQSCSRLYSAMRPFTGVRIAFAMMAAGRLRISTTWLCCNQSQRDRLNASSGVRPRDLQIDCEYRYTQPTPRTACRVVLNLHRDHRLSAMALHQRCLRNMRRVQGSSGRSHSKKELITFV